MRKPKLFGSSWGIRVLFSVLALFLPSILAETVKPGKYAIQVIGEVVCSGMFLSYDTASTAANTTASVYLQYFPTAPQAPLWRVERVKGSTSQFTLSAVKRPAGMPAGLALNDSTACAGASLQLSKRGLARWKYSGGNLRSLRNCGAELLLSPFQPSRQGRTLPPPRKDSDCGTLDCRKLELRGAVVGGLAWRFIPRPLPSTRPVELVAPFQCATAGYPEFLWAMDGQFFAARMDYDVWEPNFWFWQRTASGWRKGDLHLPLKWEDPLEMDFGKDFLAIMTNSRLLIVAKFNLSSPPLVFNISGFQTDWGPGAPAYIQWEAPLSVAADGPTVAVTGRYATDEDISFNIPPAVPFVAIYTLVDSNNPLLKSSWVGPVALNFTAQPEALQLSDNGTTLAVGLHGEASYIDHEYVPKGPQKVVVFHQKDHTSPWVEEAVIEAPAINPDSSFSNPSWDMDLDKRPKVALSEDKVAVFFANKTHPNLSFYRRSEGTWKLVQQVTPPVDVQQLLMDGNLTVIAEVKDIDSPLGSSDRLQRVAVFQWSAARGQWSLQGPPRILPQRDKVFIRPKNETNSSRWSPIMYRSIALNGRTLAVPAMFNYFTARQSPWIVHFYKL